MIAKQKWLYTLLILLSFSGFKAGAQSLYEIKFADAANVQYNCLLVYFNEDNSYMRIAYTVDNKYYVANVDYKTITGKNSQGADFFYLKGAKPWFVTEAKNNYNPDFFIWYSRDNKPQVGPYQTDDPAFKNQKLVTSYKQLKPAQLNDVYLKQFYNTNEQNYFAMRKICGLDKTVVLDGLKLKIPNTKLHLIIAANTLISDIGQSCGIDERNIESEFRDIAKLLNIEFVKYVVDGQQFSKANMEATLQKLVPGSNDIVIFAYSGHGFRYSDQKEQYPNMDFRYSAYDPLNSTTSTNLADVYNKIVAKGARLNIVLGDCCNSDIGRNQLSSSTFLSTKSNVSPSNDKLKRLFLNAKGNIISTAAQPGEFSWGNNSYGGYFTSSFVQALREEISFFTSTQSSWDNIIFRTIDLAKYKTSPSVCSSCKVQSGLRFSKVTY